MPGRLQHGPECGELDVFIRSEHRLCRSRAKVVIRPTLRALRVLRGDLQILPNGRNTLSPRDRASDSVLVAHRAELVDETAPADA